MKLVELLTVFLSDNMVVLLEASTITNRLMISFPKERKYDDQDESL